MTLIKTNFSFHSTADEVINGIDLTGKRAIVTGGASGIGIEAVKTLAKAGAEVTIAENKDSVFTGAAKRNAWKVFILDVFQPRYSFDDLKAIRCPSLIIAGDNDVISLQHTIGIYEHIPDAHLWIVPNSGHATLQEHADEFNRVVSAFFLETK